MYAVFDRWSQSKNHLKEKIDIHSMLLYIFIYWKVKLRGLGD